MVTIEQKIKLFSKLIYQEVQNEIDDRTNKFNQKKADLLEQAGAEANKKALDIYKANEKKINQKKSELMTFSKIESRKKILEIKEDCIKQMMTKIEEKAKDFITTTDYEVYIENCMGQVMNLMGTRNPLEVFIREEDIQKLKDLFNKGNISINKAHPDIIGGILVVDPQNHTRVDLSIRTRLDDMKPFIINKVMEQLGEVGGGNE